MPEKLLTQREFAALTGKGRGWQWRARKSHELGYFELNGHIRYSEQHVQDYLKRHEVAARVTGDESNNKARGED